MRHAFLALRSLPFPLSDVFPMPPNGPAVTASPVSTVAPSRTGARPELEKLEALAQMYASSGNESMAAAIRRSVARYGGPDGPISEER